MNPFWNPLVAELSPYVAGEQPKILNLVKLNTNENPYGPSPKVIAAIRGAADATLRLYPDPDATSLKDAIASQYGVSRTNVFVGNGSDEVLAHVFLGLLKHEQPLLFPDITYSFYPVYAKLYGIPHAMVPVDAELRVAVDDYLEREAGAIILANPNAPTGQLLTLAELERLVLARPEIPLVIDEAYIDFGGLTAVGLTQRYPNVLVVQTLSKSRSLAGLRVGFAIGHEGLIDGLERIKNCFNSYPLDRLAIAGATAALEDVEYFERCREKVIFSRGRLVVKLESLGFSVLPSATNFVFARHPRRDAGELAERLRQQAVLVRHFRNPERISQYLRISIGTDEQCDALVTALGHILG